MVVDHLSQLEYDKEIQDFTKIKESFPDENLLVMETHFPWYVDFVNYWLVMCCHLGVKWGRRTERGLGLFFIWVNGINCDVGTKLVEGLKRIWSN